MEDNSKEDGNDTNNNCNALTIALIVWFIIAIIVTLVFRNFIAIELNLSLLTVCLFAFLIFLKQNSFTQNHTVLYSFDRLNGLSLFCVAIVVAVSFDMHIVILKLLKCITVAYLHDFLIILFYLASYFINIFFIFTLSSSFFCKISE